MKILLAHNRYLWSGGEDSVVEAETTLLRAGGNEVVEHLADNRAFLDRGRAATLLALWRGAWSDRAYREFGALVAEHRPDVVHVHNFWYALSPAILSAAHDARVPVVVTLHNFRLLCPGGVLLDKAGQPCNQCVGRLPWHGAARRCYHNSLLASAAVARMIRLNRRRGTWDRDVDLFLVPSEFCRRTFVRGGLPEAKIVVKPNFVEDPLGSAAAPAPEPTEARRVLFVGRLSREKGLGTLLTAWSKVEKTAGAELRIIGEGPLADELRERARGLNISFAGRVGREELFCEIGQAALTVLSSECYETFGRVVVEAYAMGRPAVVSNLGGPAELVRDGETGLLFEPGNAEDLAAKLTTMLRDKELRGRLGRAARAEYLAKYTPEVNYAQLMAAYGRAAEIHKNCPTSRPT